jgi:hypothetical protein
VVLGRVSAAPALTPAALKCGSMPTVRPLLRRCAVALLLAAGLLQPWAAPAAQACTIGIRQEFVPLSKATVDDFRWASAANRDYLTVNVPDPLPEGAVAFEGTAVSTTLCAASPATTPNCSPTGRPDSPWGRSCPCSPPCRSGPPPGGAPGWGRG